MTPISIRSLTKRFGPTTAVDAIDLDIPAGDLFFLLGPSGCGKTTLLRMIAGFSDPNAGSIHFDNDEVTHTPANQRDTGMVFQGYALWPHMTVAQNVRFGLEVRKLSKQEMKQRVDAALASVQLTPYADRKTNQLSGGQQQRVALARALVIKPRVLLLDEPLSNLDAKLRLDMRQQIRDICKESGITGVYVTHDQHEALSMADNIAVLESGKVVQTGAPTALYTRPANRFVADFLGETNFLPAEVTAAEAGHIVLSTPFGPLTSTTYPDDLPKGGAVTISIRPEALKFTPEHGAPEAAAEPRASATGEAADRPPTSGAVTSGGPTNTLTATHQRVIYLGSLAQHRLTHGDEELKVFELNPQPRPTGQDVTLQVKPADVVILRD